MHLRVPHDPLSFDGNDLILLFVHKFALRRFKSFKRLKGALEGICGSHVGGRSLASKVIRAGFYWPSVREDCVNILKYVDIIRVNHCI